MTVFYTKPVSQLNPSLLPAAYDQWGVSTKKYIERASTTRPVSLMSWHPHVVAEGFVRADDYNLRRALRDEGVLKQ